MPRQEQVLSVFVASPDDVVDERTTLEEVIREFNIAWSRTLGVRLDLVRWETHAYPGIDEDVQSVINQKIPDDYDIFIGIMWCRYGTATGRSGSGTVEEFERAKTRNESAPNNPKLMVYFRDTPIAPSLIDTNQMGKVNEFRESLGDEGVLYWRFTSLDEFEKLIRLHLTQQIQAWKSQLEETILVVAEIEVNTEVAGADVGILDLMDVFEDSFGELNSITERITAAAEDLATKMTGSTAEMELLVGASQGTVNRKAAKRLIGRTAAHMTHYAARMEAELPLLSNALNGGLNAFIGALDLSVDLETNGDDSQQTEEGLQAIISFRSILDGTQDSIAEFRQIVVDLPPVTSEFNKARRQVISVIDRLANEFSVGQSLLRECEKIVLSISGGIISRKP